MGGVTAFPRHRHVRGRAVYFMRPAGDTSGGGGPTGAIGSGGGGSTMIPVVAV